MCGITGVVDADTSMDKVSASLERAASVQRHRGPDDRGERVETIGPWIVGLGHQRLSILDLSAAGHQPLVAPPHQDVIIYNGEVYNYLELRHDLEAEGVRFCSDTDTEVVAAALAIWGVRPALERFNGMWAFALLDHRNRKLVLARDRAGIKPLYWWWGPRRLHFASELKGLLALGDQRHRLHYPSVRAYLTQSLIDFSPETLFDDITQLPAGCYAEIDLSQGALEPRVQRYWEPPLHASPPTSQAAMADDIAAVFADAVRLRLRSDVPVGVLLSGGLDSSSIAAMAVRGQEPRPPALLAAVSDDPRFDESEHIRRVARHLGQPAHEVHIDLDPESTFDLAETATWYNDAPLNELSNIAHFKLMEAARDLGITVILSGQGADELLCGYKKYFAFHVQGLLRARRPVSAAAALASSMVQGTVIRQFNVREARRYLPSWADRQPSLTGPALQGIPGVYLGLADGATLQARQALDLTSLSVPHLNHTEDRMSMAFSREVRLPFLDVRLIEKLLPLEPRYKIRNGWTKFIFRKALERYLPPSTTWRKDKRGFTIPQSVWLRDRLRPRVLQYFEPSALLFAHGLVDRDALLATYRRYAQESEMRGSVAFRDVFAPLALEIWLRQFDRYIAR